MATYLGSTHLILEVRGDTPAQVDRLVKAIEKSWAGLCPVDAARIAQEWERIKLRISDNVAVVVFSQHAWPGYVSRPLDWRLQAERTIEGLSEEPYRDNIDCAMKQSRLCDMLEHELPAEQWQMVAEGSVLAVSPSLASEVPEEVLTFEVARWLATVFMGRVGLEEAAQGCRHVYQRYSGMGRVVVDRLAHRILRGSQDPESAQTQPLGILAPEYWAQVRDFQHHGEDGPAEPDGGDETLDDGGRDEREPDEKPALLNREVPGNWCEDLDTIPRAHHAAREGTAPAEGDSTSNAEPSSGHA